MRAAMPGVLALIVLTACSPDAVEPLDALSTPGPVADAGFRVTGPLGDTFRFDGSDSTGEALTWAWSFGAMPDHSQLTEDDLLGADGPAPAFIPDVSGQFELVLRVCDDEGRCDVDSTFAMSTDGRAASGAAPIADPGAAQSVILGDTVQLDGSGSTDPEGDTLGYVWSFKTLPSGSGLTNNDITRRFRVDASFQPDVVGDYVIKLYVEDGTGFDQANTTVTVGSAGNTAPVADAGADQTVTLGATVSLDASGSSDADGDPLTYKWAFNNLPSGSGLANGDIAGRFTANASFQPDAVGTFTMKAVVDDGADVDRDYVDVVVEPAGNNPPVADPGADQTVTLGSTATIDGSASYDPDGDAITYKWAFYTLPSGSALTNNDFADRFAASTTFDPDVEGDFVLKLVVDDGTEVTRAFTTVTVTAPANGAPVADAGPDQSSALGQTVSLDGTGSTDPDGDPLSYRWAFNSLPAGSTLTNGDIAGRYTATGGFDPDVAGDYEMKLVVEDGAEIDRDYVTITVDAYDLEATAVDAGPYSVSPGDIVIYSLTVANNGSSTIESFDVDLYYSTNTIISETDDLICSGSTSYSHGAGVTVTYTAVCEVPAIADGTYYFGVLLDPEDALFETDETNNTAVDSLDVTLASGMSWDLEVTGAYAIDYDVTATDSVTYEVDVTNNGPSDISYFDIDLFYSADTTIEITDEYICGGTTTASHPAFTTLTYTLTCAVPSISSGSWTFGAMVDAVDHYVETDETNNSGYDVLTVTVN
ncbi:MAG: hypothetical protein H6739_14180 [Alphaproteobacteria bacterium]|nr:hypothetical protein [Alphaproteobacteria bacterium]